MSGVFGNLGEIERLVLSSSPDLLLAKAQPALDRTPQSKILSLASGPANALPSRHLVGAVGGRSDGLDGPPNSDRRTRSTGQSRPPHSLLRLLNLTQRILYLWPLQGTGLARRRGLGAGGRRIGILGFEWCVLFCCFFS